MQQKYSHNETNAMRNCFCIGDLVLLGDLEYKTTPIYELVIGVSDGGIDGVDVLTSTTTISITVIHINEYFPQFDNGSVFQVTVEEESTYDNILTVICFREGYLLL